MTTTYSPPDNPADPADDVMFGHVDPPADAVQVDGWDDYGTGRWSRSFTGARHLAGHQQHVEIVGVTTGRYRGWWTSASMLNSPQ
jgi:hypothetical protein